MLAAFFDNLMRNLGGGEATGWTLFGLIANLCFAGRFVLQWWISERKKESVIPVGFWYLSLVGGVMMLVYAIHVGKIPLIIGMAFTPLIAARNLWLILRKRSGRKELEKPADPRAPAADASATPRRELTRR